MRYLKIKKNDFTSIKLYFRYIVLGTIGVPKLNFNWMINFNFTKYNSLKNRLQMNFSEIYSALLKKQPHKFMENFIDFQCLWQRLNIDTCSNSQQFTIPGRAWVSLPSMESCFTLLWQSAGSRPQDLMLDHVRAQSCACLCLNCIANKFNIMLTFRSEALVHSAFVLMFSTLACAILSYFIMSSIAI